MPEHFQIVKNYFKKKYNRNAVDGMPQTSGNPIPDLKLNSIFRQRTFSERTGFSKYLLEFDIATQAVIGIFVLLLLGSYIIAPELGRGVIASITQPKDSTAAITAAEQKIRQSVAKKVYANTIPISADKIFSVPADNITLAVPGTPNKEVYGFFPYWMLDHQEQIRFDALTTVALFGLDVDGEGNIVTGTGDGQPNPGWRMWNDPKLTPLITRARREGLTIELTIKAFNNADIENLARSDEAQKRFIANAIFLIQSKSLDGINLDFEYTGTPDTDVTEGFTRLTRNLRAELKRQMPDSTLTIDTYASAASIRGLFDVQVLAEYTDSLVIMGYDIHTPSGAPGPVAPFEGQVSILGFIQSYLEKVSPDKLILAVPYYGYDWQTDTSEDNNAYMLSYAEIAEKSKAHQIGWDENARTPFYSYVEPETNQNRIVHFENVRSLGTKYDFINSKNLKGVGIWALGYDGQYADLHNLLVEKFAK